MKDIYIFMLLFSFVVQTTGAQMKYSEKELSYNPSASTLAEQLGFQATDRILIVNGDDAAMSHAANMAVIDAMENGLMTSSTIMTPCPWFAEIAEYAKNHPASDFGVHLTHTSEWTYYKWPPIAGRNEVPGLMDPLGFLWPDVGSVYEHATPEQAETEARAQIEKCLSAGIDITHLDSHMGTLHFNEAYHQVYRKLALEYNLPIRMAGQELIAALGFDPEIRTQLKKDGIVCPDVLIHGMQQENESTAEYWKRILRNLSPGVTELYIHAALPSEEMKPITGSWETRAEEYRLFTTDKEIRDIIRESDIKLVGYRPLRTLQRMIRKDK